MSSGQPRMADSVQTGRPARFSLPNRCRSASNGAAWVTRPSRSRSTPTSRHWVAITNRGFAFSRHFEPVRNGASASTIRSRAVPRERPIINMTSVPSLSPSFSFSLTLSKVSRARATRLTTMPTAGGDRSCSFSLFMVSQAAVAKASAADAPRTTLIEAGLRASIRFFSSG